MRLLLLLAIFFAALTLSFGNPVPQRGALEEVQEEVLAEVHQEGDLPQVVGQEGGHTTTMVSPDLLVEILELLPLLAGLALPEAYLLSPLPMQLVVSLENSASGPCSTWISLLSSSQTLWAESLVEDELEHQYLSSVESTQKYTFDQSK